MDKSPDAFRTISEVADLLGIPQHVLRFWETRFPQIKPLKRGGGVVIIALMISICSMV
ncbi:MerR HTH family regulatory protein [Bartonella sp. A1379B]|nr:MerR HTH family regulatory protein [Bartonella sp. A1379B]AQX23905.1 MerR HTH family regulatory protein [Bartonella sp. 114]